MELVHSHIAKMPPALGNGEWGIGPGVRLRRELGKPTPLTPLQGGGKLGSGGAIPEVIENIVIRLMAKNAEERYQSALGLKYDLERCRQEWEATGKITTFELGTRDLCDRFLIPEKLYGREMEVEKLLAAFERVANPDGGLPFSKRGQGRVEMMLVAGFSGIGKTAVINEVHKPIVRRRGYFIKGKFDQFNRNIPFSAFVQAFRELMGQLLGSSDAELQGWKEKILTAVRESGQVLIEVIPELERIIGKQPPAPELSGSAAQNRFNLLLQRFIAVFTTPKHPLVMFLDDLQWADSASLDLIKVLMGSEETGYLLMLGAYRDNEVYPAHPLMLTLKELEKERAVISTIVLEPLASDRINHLVAATLSCDLELADPLTELVYQKTKGNPFFTTQFLKGLHQDGLIAFNLKLGYWECDLSKVRDAALTEDVVEFMAGRLALLPEATQKALKLAACIGNQFELETLATICEESSEEVAADIWSALQEGLILPTSEAYKFFQGGLEGVAAQTVAIMAYRFLHDRVQQAAYSLIPEDKRQITHLSIGKILLLNQAKYNHKHSIFDIVNNFNIAKEIIQEYEEKLKLARLNLTAGKKAREATAYQAAFDYFSIGLRLVGQQGWEEDYDLTMLFHQEGAIAASLIGQFNIMNEWINIGNAKTKKILDMVPFYETQIQALVAQKKLSQAIKMGIEILKHLGESFSENPKPEYFPLGIKAISDSLAERKIEDLINLPPMADPQELAILRVLWRLSSVLVMAAPQLMPFCTFKAVQLSLASGNSILSAPAYVTYGMILCGAVGDISTGYRFGKLALLVEKYQGKEVEAKTIIRFNAGVRHWQEPLQNTLDTVAKSYQLALEVGDLKSAAISAEVYGYHGYFSGKTLEDLSREMEVYSQGIQSINQQTIFYWNETYRQHVLNLIGQSDNPCYLVGTAYDENIHLPMQRQYNDGFGLAMAYLFKAIGCYLFERYEEAIENLNITAGYLQSFAPFASAPAFYFYRSLAYLSYLYACDGESELPEPVEIGEEKIKHWANHSPMNHQHKLELIQAEKYRILGKKYEAGDYYDRAIAGAKANEYIQEEALANELAAKFYLDWSLDYPGANPKEKIAATYMQEAYYCYARWGAKAKTDDLEKRYPNLLQPILQQTVQTPNSLDTLTRLTPKIAVVSSMGTAESPNANLNKSLDLAAVIKAYQVIASTIHIEDLIHQIT
ncbi:MAG: AAA family ATPase, partial [Oscillatoria sp. SIO1A7]|nr:AAA family ATPase [Oscillatoria sp. SIO1A7]